MPLTPGEIKDKLVNALDDEKNVIDEEAIEEVITLLEASTLSKEILEQTRLGRDINLVRKTCKNPLIARRAKNLVKSWQKLLVQPSSPQVANGQHPNNVPSPQQRASPAMRVSPGLSPALMRSNGPNRCLPSPALTQVRQQQLKAAGGAVCSPSLTSGKPGLVAKSKTGRSPRPVTRSASINVTNEDSNLSWPGTPPTANESTQDRLAADSSSAGSGAKPAPSGSQKRHFNFDSKPADHSNVSTSKSNRASDQRDVSKTNVANRKRTRGSASVQDSSNLSPDFPSSKQPRLNNSSPSLSTSALSKNDVINGSLVKKAKLQPLASSSASKNLPTDPQDAPEDASNPVSSGVDLPRQDSVSSRLSTHSIDSRASRSKTNRVKTTEQLIEDMQLRSATSVGTDVIQKIRTQQIQKESELSKPNPPATGKRRGRKKKKGNEPLKLPDAEEAVSEGRKLAQTKSEYIKRFLQTSVAPTPGEDNYEATTIPHSRQESLEEQPIALGECSSTFSQSTYESGFPSYPSRQDKPDSGPSASPPDVREILEGTSHGLHPGGDTSNLSRLTEEQILALLPPIDFGNIDWTSHDYPSPQRAQVGDSLVERLHSENIDGVNGTYDRDGQFRQWDQMLTTDSVYDEPLYILPYVIPND